MKDIVKRLRQTWWSDDYGVSKDDLCDARNEEAAAAADEIELLREEAERLRAERDEARREVCELLYNRQGGWPKEHATERGWDCFEKGKP